MSAPLCILCACGADLAEPQRLGLAAGTSLEAPWLKTYRSAAEARAALGREDTVAEVWVASSEEVQAVNLAAALKGDHPQYAVFLVGGQSGSTRSRANAAGLDGVLGPGEFAARFEAAARKGVAPDGSQMVGRCAESCHEAAVSAAGGDGARPDGGFDASGVTSRGDSPSGGAPGRPTGFLLTVVSGSGGAGKSTVAVLAAHLAARRGLRTALLDGDLQFGDLHELAGPCPALSIEEAAADPAALAALADEALVLVSAPRNLERAEAVGDLFETVVAQLAARFDLVVVNTGGSWSDLHAHLLEQSAASVFLVDQRASSVRACRHALDLCLRCGIATGSFLLAVNRCGRHAPFTSIDVSSALHGAHVAELADGGPEVEELLGAGLASTLAASGNGLCASVEAMLDELLPTAARGVPATAQESVMARFGLARSRVREPRRSRRGRASRRREAAAPAASEAVKR
ncbi:chromosome partitioning protein ParA [Enterorhabdus sp. NM05_H27]|nr:chromosome partitioning protein ParA [Enterorhabdus sp. NM05_H27]